ncbi:MAG: RNA polymerase-binding protein DksA [Emcibacteraceae bacterium]|nr:RNA polymerase-binding protein DksA [Emcibacteraceae bacterium]
MLVELPDGYEPSDTEEFMNDMQLEFFRQKLVTWKESIMIVSRETLSHLQEDSLKEPDIADRASAETDWSVELRTRDRQRKLVMKIDAAIKRIEKKEYGYCEVSGEQISLKRLQARPIATMTIESQENHENYERVHRDN